MRSQAKGFLLLPVHVLLPLLLVQLAMLLVLLVAVMGLLCPPAKATRGRALLSLLVPVSPV